MKVVLWIGGVVAVLLVLLLAFAATRPGAGERSIERQAIRDCWEQVEDELLPIAQRRLYRDSCRHMESEYERKWGRKP